MAKGGMPEGIKTVMYWALGIGVVALILLILLILFGNLSGNVGFGQDSADFINHTTSLVATDTNATDLTGRINPGLTNVVVTNATNGSNVVSSTNYTIDGGNLRATGPSPYNGTAKINVSATLSYDGRGKVDTQNLILNYTTSATNVGKQLPTVGTILGVALLLVILVGILIFAIRKLMSVSGDGRKSGIGGSASNSFKGNSQEYG